MWPSWPQACITPGLRGGVRQPGGLGDRQRIHVGAQADAAVGLRRARSVATTPWPPTPATKGMPSSARRARTKAAVAFSCSDSSGWACRCRRHPARVSARDLSMPASFPPVAAKNQGAAGLPRSRGRFFAVILPRAAANDGSARHDARGASGASSSLPLLHRFVRGVVGDRRPRFGAGDRRARLGARRSTVRKSRWPIRIVRPAWVWSTTGASDGWRPPTPPPRCWRSHEPPRHRVQPGSGAFAPAPRRAGWPSPSTG